jgi:hypothetical protein
MKINLIAAFLLCLGAVGCGSDFVEGQATLSPNKKWFVDLETTSDTNSLTRIRVYDTAVYPGLKTNPNPKGNPTAEFTVPIEFYARAVVLKWNPASTVLRIEQPVLNNKPAIYYSLDLNSYSFSKVDK